MSDLTDSASSLSLRGAAARTAAILAAILLCVSLLPVSGMAGEDGWKPRFNARAGAAIEGYDVVAYFTEGEAVRGKARYKVMWKGVTWFFSTRTHREAFEANPRAYAPQYGGYCAYAMSLGETLTTDPRAWRIFEGKLYLVHDRSEIWAQWTKDIPGNIRRADAHWPQALAR